MIKYIIVDIRIFHFYLRVISNLLNIQKTEIIVKLLPIILAKIDDYRIDSGIWDILAMNTTEDMFQKIDYETVSYVVENIAEDIQLELNRTFSMPNNTFYSFQDWVGDDVKLEIYHD